jgi:hypothetical protein
MIDAPPPPATAPSTTSVPLQFNAETDQHISSYLAAGDRVASFMGVTLIVCAVLLALIAVAWVLGVLPGAVRLF